MKAKICDKCGSEGAVLAPHTGKVLCDPCFVSLFVNEGTKEAVDEARERMTDAD